MSEAGLDYLLLEDNGASDDISAKNANTLDEAHFRLLFHSGVGGTG